MANTSRLECRTRYLLLLHVAIGLSILPSGLSQYCNTHSSEPLVNISSTPPSNKLPIGASINLICTAWQTDDLAKTRPHKIEWFDPQGNSIGEKCQAESPAAARMNCTLMVRNLTEDKFGNYTCKASNVDKYCSNKQFSIIHQDIERPQIVIDPVNQSAVIGSNASFNCSATGYPEPTITWKKDNDSVSIQPVIKSDNKKTFSQLIITGVTSKDYGKYVCVANNSAGVETSKVAVLYQGYLTKEVTTSIAARLLDQTVDVTTEEATTYTGTKAPYNGASMIIAITVPVITVVMLIAVFFWNRKLRCLNSKRYDSEDPVPSVTDNRSSQENREESTNDLIETQGHASSTAPRKSEEVCRQFAGQSSEEEPLLNKILVDLPPRLLPSTPDAQNASSTMTWNSNQNATRLSDMQSGSQNHDFESSETSTLNRMKGGGDIADRRDSSLRSPPPCRPPKPRKENEENAEGDQTTNLEISEASILHRKDSDCDRQERRGSVQHSLPPPRPPKLRKEVKVNTENDEMGCIKLPEIEDHGEIYLERLEIHDKVLGEGEYGVVYKGRYRLNDEKVIDVAIKQLKDNTSATEKVALLTEIRMLKQAGQHPNIVSLVGAFTQGEIILLVTELVPGGSLETMLKSKRASGEDGKYRNINCELNDRELVNIALQVATGMQHLERKKCIHGDLAARNVFIDNNKVARVGDFGLARDISEYGIYTKTSNGKVPWRWLSLESLRDQVYTTQSDVWSFGILLWEIVTYGGLPYPDITAPAALINFLSSGKRMTRPDHCCDKMDALMQSCWRENPLMRPTFTEITKQLKYLLREIKKTYANVKDDDINAE